MMNVVTYSEIPGLQSWRRFPRERLKSHGNKAFWPYSARMANSLADDVSRTEGLEEMARKYFKMH